LFRGEGVLQFSLPFAVVAMGEDNEASLLDLGGGSCRGVVVVVSCLDLGEGSGVELSRRGGDGITSLLLLNEKENALKRFVLGLDF